MDIQVGKLYETRDGRRARVICTDREPATYPIIVLIREAELNEQVHERTLPLTRDGKDGISGDSPLDLIREWHEPETFTGVVRMDVNGCPYLMDGIMAPFRSDDREIGRIAITLKGDRIVSAVVEQPAC